MDKKILYYIAIALSILIIVGGVWFFFFRGDNTQQADSFFPFGFPSFDGGGDGFFGGGDGDGSGGGGTDIQDGTVEQAEVFQVCNTATAGATTFTKAREENPDEVDVVVRCLERATGHIFDYNTRAGERTRISNNTIPKIYDVQWGEDENTFLFRYLSDDNTTIQTFSGSVVENEGGEITIGGDFLPEDITFLSLSPDKTRLFYLREDNNRVYGFISNFDGSGAEEIFTHPFREWIPQWVGGRDVLLNTKASGVAQGYLYSLNTQTQKMDKVLGGATGITSLGHDGFVLFTQIVGSSLFTALFNRSDESFTQLGIETIPEKCAWSESEPVIYCGVPVNPPDALYPDDWYKGVVSFSDELWKINVGSGISQRIAILPQEIEGGADVIKPFLNEGESLLVFTNKKDLSVWAVRIGEE